MKTLEEVPHISPDDKELLSEITRIIHGFLPTATVLLYGSVARGSPDEQSDYDILVLTDEPLTRTKEDLIDDALYDLQLSKGVLLFASFYTKNVWDANPAMPFHQEVDRDAIVL